MNWPSEKTRSIYDLSHRENSGDASVHYQKSPVHSEDIFENLNENLIELRSKPSKILHFSSKLNSVCLKLYNDNSYPLLFKLKTTQPDIIASQPARGFIPPNSSVQCFLTPIELTSEILLVVQYAQILNQYDDYSTQWKNLKSNHIHIKKFQCSFSKENTLAKRQTLFKPILFTIATITLLTSFIYFRNK
ncbi:unnamed protein product [Adineta ricciae]|uniref:MSP domain-containing protein n=1 Tax=Adineta ricciae TaxID=249248 RepID=A0A816EHW7_ADIRI|nr:unnamed protein product [Adineta ricciae]